jgi:hypothetical protein
MLFGQAALSTLRASGLIKLTTGTNQDYTVVEVSDAGFINGNRMLRVSLTKMQVQSKRNAGNRPFFVVLFNLWPIKVKEPRLRTTSTSVSTPRPSSASSRHGLMR